MKKVKIGVLGAGHLGKIHIKLLKQIPSAELIGFYDVNEDTRQKVSDELGVKAFATINELLDLADAVDIVTPTTSHFELAKTALTCGKHFFIEKPLTNTLEEAKQLLMLAEESRVKAQVGHVERFNPAYLAVEKLNISPMFIETHRLAQFNPRGTDVSVVLDLMIHDIDIILSLVKAEVRKLSASGVAVISNSPDIANARIEFDNGCVANITASRISMKNMRKMRVFQKDTYVSMDFLSKQVEIISLEDEPKEGMNASEVTLADNQKRYVHFEMPEVTPVNSIERELSLFIDSIIHHKETVVSLTDGYRAMELAYRIIDKIAK